jgi:hypothetical protein
MSETNEARVTVYVTTTKEVKIVRQVYSVDGKLTGAEVLFEKAFTTKKIQNI